MTIGATGGGTATSITFGAGVGQVSTLNQLNTALAANNLQATINTTGRSNITTSNDAASSTIGAFGGTAAAAASPFGGLIAQAPGRRPQRASHARQSGQRSTTTCSTQINTTAQDSSFNGVNLLNGDTLKLVFNETGKSDAEHPGRHLQRGRPRPCSPDLGHRLPRQRLDQQGSDSLNSRRTTLRAQASTLGSNLSIVQIRQDFSKNLINVLQTGSSNLTLADTNEEAANSQALSTRQSIAVSALSLANQSQQSVLQLLR